MPAAVGLLEPSVSAQQHAASVVRRLIIAFVSVGALMILFYSFQGSDVSTKNGISRRRLPPDVKLPTNGNGAEPLSKHASEAWLTRETKNTEKAEDETTVVDDYRDDDYMEEDEYAATTRTSSIPSTSSTSSSASTSLPTQKKEHAKNKKQNGVKMEKESCDVNPAPRGVYVHGHGPCITQFPHQPAALGGMDDCWRLAFAVAQWEQPKNPSKAEFGDDWEATARAYPHTAVQAQQIVDDFNTKTELPISSEWSSKHPYVRLCVPTACGLSESSGCDLRETDFLMHINPNSRDVDNTTHLFYKGFVRDGHLMLPNAGLTAH